jgi:ligand-binding SRPBCC domain-containing protein
MADYVLERRCWLPRPRPQVFAFFADPRNLAELSPPGAAPQWIEPPPAVLAAGTLLDFRMRAMGIPTRWRVMIREYDPPYRFVDVQVRGPWARWEHRHQFLEEGDGTWMEDRVTYRPPLGPLGHVLHSALLERQLRAAWAFRQARLVELFGGTPAR